MKDRRQTARAVAERAANERAARAGSPLPHPNPWDAIDPTKVARDATPEQIHRRYLEFNKLCPPRARKKHTL
ncbi:MAG: hypothetical protein EXR72_01545 [Myxococcales bacterium]|nr:hypothetical protein [Myxococcales bacterium]